MTGRIPHRGSAARPAGARGWPRRVLWWTWFTTRDFFADNGVNRSAALAYITLFSLVPLLTTIALLYRSFFSAHTHAIVETITSFLPFSSAQVSNTLTEFVGRATALGGISFLVFIAVVFRLFFLIEQTLNEVWGVAARRSLTLRIFSFTMALFWGPVVMGVGTSLLLWIRAQPWAPSAHLLLTVGHVGVPFLGFTMAYWLVPHASVRLSNAMIGGVTATVGLRLLRAGFVAYLRLFPNVNLIFGSLALALIFLASIFAFWVIVIAGAEASYVAQNLDALLLGPGGGDEPHPAPVPTSILLFLECYRELAATGRPPALAELARRAGITHRYAKKLLDALVDDGLLAVTGREKEAFLPVKEASAVTLADVHACLEPGLAWTPGPPVPDPLAERIQSALEEAADRQRRILGRVTLAALLAGRADDDREAAPG